MRKLLPVFFVIFFALAQSLTAQAQDLLRDKDLSTVRVDELSDADLNNIKIQLEANNLTLKQVEPLVLQKGMSPTEFEKLQARMGQSVQPTQQAGAKDAYNGLRTQETVVNIRKKEQDSLRRLVFGSELFDNPTLNFEPDLQLATPVNYVLGPGDELQVTVFGVQELNAKASVSVEGKISIQNVGQISVAGLTIEAATQKIKSAIARIYSTVRSGQSTVEISLSRIRTIKVTIIGSKLPGNYSVSSLATVYNALYLAGGPGQNGSYRNIQVIRNNKVFTNVDIYNFLVNGNQSDNVGLKDNDVIRIPAYSQRVTLEGEVKRPGIFELKKGETFQNLLSFASGFTESAYTASVNVIQRTSREFKVKDLKEAEFDSYQPLSGDRFDVAEILDRFENRVEVTGAVFRPSTYSFTEGMRVADLIRQADGLQEDAYTSRATIVRLKSDLTTELVTVDLAKALAGDTAANPLLRREDVVKVYSVLDFKEDYNVTINGEIRQPGEYPYLENLTLNDLLVQAGGLTGAASKRVEIARLIKAETIDDRNPRKVELFNLEIDAANNEQLKNFTLQPFDVINIRKMGVYETPQMVTAVGAVAYPGIYVLANKEEKVFDIIKRAGGLTSVANINGVKIKRPIKVKEEEAIEDLAFKLSKSDSTQGKLDSAGKTSPRFATIPVDWKQILKDTTVNSNITLVPGDEIEVTLKTESVKVGGNVLLTSEIPYERRRGFTYYINAVGGVDARGWKKKSYIIYPNGKAAVTGSFLFFRRYPKVSPGSSIVVPEKPESTKLSIGEIVSISSVLVGMAGIVIAIINAK